MYKLSANCYTWAYFTSSFTRLSCRTQALLCAKSHHPDLDNSLMASSDYFEHYWME